MVPSRARSVVFLVAPGVHLLDLAGPAQVFATASELLDQRVHGADGTGAGYRASHVGESETVTSHQGLPLSLTTRWPPPGEGQIVLVPWWRSKGSPRARVPFQDATLERLVEHHDAGGQLLSVCAGAFALGAAGLLDGRRATTHHELQDELARRHPRAQVQRDVLFTVDGSVATSAGIASGIDLALHVVALDHGPALAARVARAMVVPLRRNGSALQDSTALRHRDHLVDVVHRAQDVLDDRWAERLPLADLAAAVAVSERTLTRAFRAATGTTPLHYQQQLRLERAEHLLADGWTGESAARAVGFSDARMLRRLRRAELTR